MATYPGAYFYVAEGKSETSGNFIDVSMSVSSELSGREEYRKAILRNSNDPHYTEIRLLKCIKSPDTGSRLVMEVLEYWEKK